MKSTMTDRIGRNAQGWIVAVNGKAPPAHLVKLRIPPAWKDVKVELNPKAAVYAIGRDLAGRKQSLYSPDHVAKAKAGKFERVAALRTEWEDIRTQIEQDINNPGMTRAFREAAHVALLIYETGLRPGTNYDTKAAVQSFGATTLQLRHVKPCARGVRLKFVGKKGVAQNVLVTNPYLVRLMETRKAEGGKYTTTLFNVSPTMLRNYFKCLGSGDYSPKDFRTMRGTTLALEILGSRKRLPKSKAARKRLVNDALDKVAAKLGNTRAVARSAYVDPVILERILEPEVN